jgi:DNA ligase-1
MTGLDFRYVNGAIHLPAARLWLDAHQPIGPEETVFVSHAHSDHTAAHARVLFSAPTQRLMRARVAGQRVEQVLEFGRAYDGADLGIGSRRLTLLPAGHIFGSAMSLIDEESGSLLYTGDFKLRPGRSSEPCEPRRADVLVMETTYGRPEYVFPPVDEVLAGVLRFCHEALDQDEIPVLLGYSLGKSQEVLCGLAGAGLRMMLSEPVSELTAVYASFGIPFPEYGLLDPKIAAGHVVLAPPGATVGGLRRRLGRVRVAVLTGWAVTPGCHFRYQADAAFPLSDHADFPDLVELVRQVSPRRVYTLHGFAVEFAAHLRRLGVDARALGQEEQLELPTVGWRALESIPDRRRVLDSSASGPRVAPGDARGALSSAGSPDAFVGFAGTCAEIGTQRSKIEKRDTLARYLAAVDPEWLPAVVGWFSGWVFPPSANRALQVGWAVIRDAVCEVTGLTQATFRQVYLKHSDTGATVEEVMHSRKSPDGPAGGALRLSDVAEAFEGMFAARGPSAKRPVLAAVLQRCSPLEARYLVKILTGNLRIGLKEGLVEESVARAFGVPADGVREAHQCTGDLGETARLARERRLASAGVIPFRPVRVMLASPEPDADAILARVQEWGGVGDLGSEAPRVRTVWIEDKYDGIRCQLHRRGDRVMLFSRDLKDVTPMFPELAASARRLSADVILDGEVVAMEGGRVLPFQELQRRLGRREGDLFLSRDIPVRLVVFDLLWWNGEDLLRTSLRRRRDLLDQLTLPTGLLRAAVHETSTREEIESAFVAARARGNEGLLIKDPNSAYLPGRRGIAWLKLKRPGATLDCVVVGAEYGHGRRHGVLSDYTFAVRDVASGELKTIGKAYTGLTNEEIARLTVHFLSRVRRQAGRYHEVEPDVVLEIAFDSLQPSARHSSGLAMRFPRIVRIRDDKGVGDIDTIETAWRWVPRRSAER